MRAIKTSCYSAELIRLTKPRLLHITIDIYYQNIPYQRTHGADINAPQFLCEGYEQKYLHQNIGLQGQQLRR